ncbi:MAG: hypothetical protein GC149_13665 [Gammaproteobacteria bacterium]|nr:hypothetical protein [Gammaproteobacteria bacterium]
MKDRLITLLGAVIAFYILLRLLFPQINFAQKDISYPTSEDRGKFGLAGSAHWLSSQHVPIYSLRQRYDTLAKTPELSPRGNLLIISLPLRLDAQHKELQQLQQWIRQGNSALLLIAMSDWPPWADRMMSDSVTRVLNNFDLDMTLAAEPDSETKDKSDKHNPGVTTAKQLDKLTQQKSVARILIPADAHPLTAGVHKIETTWLDSEGLRWHLEGNEQLRSSLVLLRDQADKNPALWLNFYGHGRLLISRHSDMFGNVSLALADNAVLFADMVQQLLGKNGKVIFDDMHQGLSAIYDPDAFFHDPRLHHTLLFLLALWIVYVMGYTNRFGQVRQRKPVLQLRQHVQAVGNLFARRLHPSAVALRHAHHFFNEVRSCYGLPQNGQPVWEQLQRNAAIAPSLLQQAQSLYQRAQQQQRINLITFVNTLKTMRRELQ